MISNLHGQIVALLFAKSKQKGILRLRLSQGAPTRHTRPFAPTSSTNCQREGASASSWVALARSCLVELAIFWTALHTSMLASFLQLAGVSAPVAAFSKLEFVELPGLLSLFGFCIMALPRDEPRCLWPLLECPAAVPRPWRWSEAAT